MSAADVRAFVEANDDFSFEMKVAGLIRTALGVEVFQGATYTDPVTLKPRQFDVRFRVQEERKTLYFAVECKNVDPAKPVIICGRPAESKESFHHIIVSRGQSPHVDASMMKARSLRFPTGGFVGKSILKPGRESEIHEGWSQALASAHDLVVEAVEKGSPFDLQSFGAVFPWLVVPDGSLWQVGFDPEGRIGAPQTVDHCRFFVGHHYEVPHAREKICLTHIEFMTLTGLAQNLHQLHGISRDWEDWIPSEIRNSYRNG
jgi:hypothetical protein